MPVMKTLLTLTINILIVMIILMSMTHNNRMHALPRGKHRRQQLEDVNSIGDPLSSSEERRRDFLPSMWTLEKYPNPVLSPEYCRVEGPSSYVCDPDEIMTADQYRSLNHLIRQISSNSKCHCSSCAIDKHGVSIGIAVAKSIFRPYNILPLNNTMDFAESLRKKWKLGICENDIVILLTTSDRLWYVAYGSKAKRIFPPQSLEKITENNKLSFSAGKYYEGLESMITHFHSELINLENGLYQSPENIVVESNTNIIIGIFFLILVSVVLVVVLILTMVHCIRKKRRTSRQSYPTGSLDPASEKLQSKAKEAGEDGWLTQCVPCGPLQNNGKQQAQIVYNTAERRRLKPSSIEETREPDEIDTPASRDEVYRETTMPS